MASAIRRVAADSVPPSSRRGAANSSRLSRAPRCHSWPAVLAGFRDRVDREPLSPLSTTVKHTPEQAIEVPRSTGLRVIGHWMGSRRSLLRRLLAFATHADVGGDARKALARALAPRIRS